MSLLFLLEVLRTRKPVSKSFPVGTTSWTPPAGVTKIDNMIGKGANGTAASSRPVRYEFAQTMFYPTGGTPAAGSRDVVGVTDPYFGGGGGDYPEPTQYYDWGYSIRTHTFLVSNVTTPATTGASTTGFGKTFPGGNGGAASSASYQNVPVAAGQPQSITVPTGGSLTITYQE